MVFINSALVASEKAIETEKHANNNNGDIRYNHYLRRSILLAYINLRPSEQDMIRETIDDLQIYGKKTLLRPPIERSDFDHKENYYLKGNRKSKNLLELRIKALRFIATFTDLKYSIKRTFLFKKNGLVIKSINHKQINELFDLFNSYENFLKDSLNKITKSLTATGNRLKYEEETELAYIEDSNKKKIREIDFRENSSPKRFFKFMWKNKEKKVSFKDIRKKLKLLKNQKTTVSQWVSQLDLKGFFVINSNKKYVIMRDIEKIKSKDKGNEKVKK